MKRVSWRVNQGQYRPIDVLFCKGLMGMLCLRTALLERKAQEGKWRRETSKTKTKLTHEVVCGFRVNSIELSFIPHIVGYLCDTGHTPSGSEWEEDNKHCCACLNVFKMWPLFKDNKVIMVIKMSNSYFCVLHVNKCEHTDSTNFHSFLSFS